MGVQPVQAAVYEDFGNSQDDITRIWADRLPGPEHKSRVPITSRPGSTVAYSRNDPFTPMYSASPAPESMQGRAGVEHQDAFDQFNVSQGFSLRSSSDSQRYAGLGQGA